MIKLFYRVEKKAIVTEEAYVMVECKDEEEAERVRDSIETYEIDLIDMLNDELLVSRECNYDTYSQGMDELKTIPPYFAGLKISKMDTEGDEIQEYILRSEDINEN